MLYSTNESGSKILATPGGRGVCPACGDRLVAKCGDINIWHWAHKNANSCDSWYELESQWHLQWKAKFPTAWTEVTIRRGEYHIADLLLPSSGTVVEFQHSPISPDEIAQREIFYKKMLWVFDIRDSGTFDELGESRFELRRKGEYWTFRWKHPKKHIAFAKKDTYLDLGYGRVFYLKKLYQGPPSGGWGYLIGVDKFTNYLMCNLGGTVLG